MISEGERIPVRDERIASIALETVVMVETDCVTTAGRLNLPRQAIFTRVDKYGSEVAGLYFDGSSFQPLSDLPRAVKLRILRPPIFARTRETIRFDLSAQAPDEAVRTMLSVSSAQKVAARRQARRQGNQIAAKMRKDWVGRRRAELNTMSGR